MPKQPTVPPRIPEHPQERQCIVRSYFNDAKGSIAHINGSVDPRYRHLFDVVTSQDRFKSGLGIGGKMWLVDLYRFQNVCSIEFEVIGDITDPMKEKPYQQMKTPITKNL